MEQLKQRLINLGYSPDETDRIIGLYRRVGDLDGLEDYVISKEAINESLIEI